MGDDERVHEHTHEHAHTLLAHWETVSSRVAYEAAPWVRLSVMAVRLPDGRVIDDYYKVELQDYSGIYAQTEDGRVIVERQYKHGIGRVSLMLPGGAMKDGESPLETAQRELLEETGYVAPDWEFLGAYVTDSNHLGSRAHLYLARNARRVAAPDSGDLEDMDILLMTPEELMRGVREGEVASLGAMATIALATVTLAQRASP